ASRITVSIVSASLRHGMTIDTSGVPAADRGDAEGFVEAWGAGMRSGMSEREGHLRERRGRAAREIDRGEDGGQWRVQRMGPGRPIPRDPQRPARVEPCEDAHSPERGALR